MNRSPTLHDKEKLAAAAAALDELWAQVGASGESAEERGQRFAEIARLEQTVEDLKQVIATHLTDI